MEEHSPRITPVKTTFEMVVSSLFLTTLKNISGAITVVLFAVLFALGAAFCLWVGHYQPEYGLDFFEFIRVALTY